MTSTVVETQSTQDPPTPDASSPEERGGTQTAATNQADAPTGPAEPTRPTVDIAIADEVSATLTRRGYLTTEWWTTVIGAALSALIALIGVPGPTAMRIAAIGGPVVLAVCYAIVRSLHKSRLAQLLAAALPQSDQPV